jgi:ubiquinone/menaquinone biosynthesis C-methylase UbiE
VLEIGCGRGVGTELLLDVFGAARVDAFDLDPDMVAPATQRLAPHGDRVRLWVGDATAIDAPDAHYGAVFDFGIIHHVPTWRDAIGEVRRVLRPGGRFFAEEMLADFIYHPVWRRLLEHPMHDRFDATIFREALEAEGLRVMAERALLNQAAWWVAEKISTA